MAKLSTSTVFGDLLVDGTIYGNVTGNLTGNASTATSATTANSAATWTTARSLQIGNSSKSVNGSENVSWTLAEIGALPLSGGTMTGKITTPNNAPGITIGDDVTICDRNVANFMVLEGSTATSGGIIFGSDKDTNIYRGGANILKTDDTFNAVAGFQWNGESLDTRYAKASHGSHTALSTVTPKVAGTAAVGSDSGAARGDHVHPAQTSVSGNAGTATKLATAREIKIGNTGKNFDGSVNVSWTLSEIGAAASSHTHNQINSRGNVTCETGANVRPAANGLSMAQVYNNGYPTAYGNVLSMKGTGDGQLLIGWSGTSGAHAPVYVRSRRDTSDADWSGWAQVYTSANKPTAADLGLGNTVIAVNSDLTNVNINGFDSMMTTVNSNLNKL